MALPPGDLIAAEPPAAEEIQAVPVRHLGRWVAAVIVAVIAVSIIHSMASNPNFEWGVVGHYLFDPRITRGVVVDDRADARRPWRSASCSASCSRSCACRPTRWSAAAAGSTSGSSAARRCSCSCCSGASSPRSTRRSRSGFRSARPSSTSNANTLITGFLAVVLGLGLNEGAYMSEIVRAGIISVDEGQTEAALSLGMTPPADDAPDRPAAGDAGDHPADRQRDDLDAEDDLARPRRRLHRADDGGREHLRQQLRDDPAADRRLALVPRDHLACSTSASTTSSATSPAAPRASCRRRRCSACAAASSPPATTSWRWARPPTWRGRTPDDRADGQGRGRPQALRAPRGAVRRRRSRSAAAR